VAVSTGTSVRLTDGRLGVLSCCVKVGGSDRACVLLSVLHSLSASGSVLSSLRQGSRAM